MDTLRLTPEQKNAIYLEMKAEEKARKESEKKERSTYEQLKDTLVKYTFTKLQTVSSMLQLNKEEIFKEFQTVLDMKKAIYKLTDEKMITQQSHTFTTTDGSVSIIIGQNVNDRWDETVSAGLEKVNQWLGKLAKDEQSAVLVSLIRDLMKPNKDGVLKANRILDLSKKASEIGDQELIEAVDLIRDAYRPEKTSTYIKAKYKDEMGKDQFLALSMSSV